jgi:hypothetical protein
MSMLLSYVSRRRRRCRLVSLCIGCLVALQILHNLLAGIESADNRYRQRDGCSCTRPRLPVQPATKDEKDGENLCSVYATRRGPYQRIISISLYGPSESPRFEPRSSLAFLADLINDTSKIYSDDFILRVHHDDTLNLSDVICPIECHYSFVDFCNMHGKRFIPPKIWRFIPAGDPLVDVGE